MIQVLLLSAILSMMALQFTLSSRQQVTIATDLQNKIQAEIKLRNLESRLLFTLLTLSKNDVDRALQQEDEIGRLWNFYGKPFTVSDGATVSIQDVNGLLSVYGVSNSDKLKKLLLFLGKQPQEAQIISSNLQYWQGYESNQFTTIKGNVVRGDHLLSVGELKNIDGIDDKLYRRLSPLVTRLQNVLFNPMTAPLPLLQAELSPEICMEVEKLRKEGKLTRQRFSELTQIQEGDSITFAPGMRLQIELTASVGASVAKKRFIAYLRPENRFPVVWFQ
ncbi:type II secretion system protein GspK [Shewanella psychrotolerans]|uniref:type II secretion system protein GspK n=1 Tax=Shewanella psychrotolerans TaxID=2864206 RepID=UPI001C65E551|nr:type II secretion system protein GspK [Shewanella psychrotolerans]QYK00283.1 general secretion pathway protein GspK [Shewanella psychrotolerans]